VASDAREHQIQRPDGPRFYANLVHPIGTVQGATYLIAGSGEPAGLISAVRHAIGEVDRGLPMTGLRTVNEQIDRRLVTRRLLADLSAFFGGLALVMAAIGLYGVMAYSMSRRTSEIGLRMALGASETGVLRMVLGETLRLVAMGVAIGLPCALAASRMIASQLFGLTWADPGTIGLAIATIFCTTLAAGYVPARRAARIDPMNALRND
jgi:predicted lysophospholipase L1 biosynthesis ABC-type transport system permease subunit